MRLLMRVLVLMMFLTVNCSEEQRTSYPYYGNHGFNILSDDVYLIESGYVYSVCVKTDEVVRIEIGTDIKMWSFPFFDPGGWTITGRVLETDFDADCKIIFSEETEVIIRYYINDKKVKEKTLYF